MLEPGEKARRRATRETVSDELDDLIHRYKRSAREPWQFCSLGDSAAWAVEDARERGEEIDSWAAGEPRRRR